MVSSSIVVSVTHGAQLGIGGTGSLMVSHRLGVWPLACVAPHQPRDRSHMARADSRDNRLPGIVFIKPIHVHTWRPMMQRCLAICHVAVCDDVERLCEMRLAQKAAYKS